MGGIARRRLHSVTFHNPAKSFKGYTFFIPFWEQSRAYLVDMEDRLVNYWQMPGRPPFLLSLKKPYHIKRSFLVKVWSRDFELSKEHRIKSVRK